mgnify:FL=1
MLVISFASVYFLVFLDQSDLTVSKVRKEGIVVGMDKSLDLIIMSPYLITCYILRICLHSDI